MWVWLLFGNAVDSNVRICLQDGQPSTSGFRILSDIQLVSDADPNPYVGIVWDDGDAQARLAKCMRCAASGSCRKFAHQGRGEGVFEAFTDGQVEAHPNSQVFP